MSWCLRGHMTGSNDRFSGGNGSFSDHSIVHISIGRCVLIIILSARLTSAGLSSEAKVVDATGGKQEASDKVCEITDAPVLNLTCGIILVSLNEEV